jgi:2-polyprenyl-3-methyl-5-hydroxy-6-metoxy-1,4-benzoquinol methylase
MSLNEELELLNKEYAANQAQKVPSAWSLRSSSALVKANSFFQGRVIRILNSIIEKLQYSKTKLDSETELKLHNLLAEQERKYEAQFKELSTKISELEKTGEIFRNKVEVLDSVTKGLESIVGLIGKPISQSQVDSKEVANPDFNYLLLENRFRGSEEVIKNKLVPYADIIKDSYLAHKSQGSILEVGCGRGELLELLNDRSIPCQGIELDTGMYALAQNKGLKVSLGDVNQGLKNTTELLAGVTAFQVVEHMPHKYLLEFLELSFNKIEKGGILILETINTSSLIPLMQNYFRDPTHTAPLHPDTLCFLVEQAGFQVKTIHKTAQYPKEALIQEIPEVEELPFRYQELSRQLNDRINVLNRLMFDSQDYAVEAYKP